LRRQSSEEAGLGVRRHPAHRIIVIGSRTSGEDSCCISYRCPATLPR
jgi:hypothetical protein